MEEVLLTKKEEQAPRARSMLTAALCGIFVVLGCTMWASGEATAYGETTAEESSFPAVELDAACKFTVEFQTMSGGIPATGSGTGAKMQFLVGGKWTSPEWLFKKVGDPIAGAAKGEIALKQFDLSQWPTQMKIIAGGLDALGYQSIDFVLSSGVTYNIIQAPGTGVPYPT